MSATVQTDPVLLRKFATLIAAKVSQDQLVFIYERDNGKIVTRFVTPVEIDDINDPEANMLCWQTLPESGYRKFKISKVRKIHRVINRSSPE